MYPPVDISTMMIDALIFTALVSAYVLPWLVLTAILEATIWRDRL